MIGPIDERVVNLVEALNSLPAIGTFSSCGGHSEVTIVSQVPEGQFYVNFNVDPTEVGWDSLDLIAEACWPEDEVELAELKVWFDGGVNFDLRGECDPDVLAQRITELEAARDVDLTCRDCGIEAWRFEEDGRVVHEDFYVTDDLWAATCPDDGIFCIGCFERRLGRDLCREDFKGPPRELFGDPPSARFVARFGAS